MKKLLALGLSALMLAGIGSAAGCTNDSRNSSGESVIYKDVIPSPACPQIDESGYTVLYFDDESGNDANDGHTETTAKKSLRALTEAVSAVRTPTKILLKAGVRFDGHIVLDGYSATAEKPLIIGRYGSETERPLIVSDADQAIHVLGENVRISDLEISNKEGLRGICVQTNKNGASRNFVVENCYIHDVQWNWTFDVTEEQAALDIGNYDVKKVCPDDKFQYSTSGIYFTAPAKEGDEPRWFENVWILGNDITRVGRAGIITYSEWVVGNGCQWVGLNKFRSLDDGWYPPKNVVISGNNVSYVGGDAIVTIGAQDCWMEYNTSYHAAMLGRYGFACAGIWPVNARRVYMQFNEASFTHLDNGCTDGEGFDIDVGCSDVVFQYNYSHDNGGGGLLICNTHAVLPVYDENGNPVLDEKTGEVKTFVSAGNWNNNRIRNNVFVCDGKTGTNAALLVMSSDCKNIICENNIVVIAPDMIGQQLINSADYGKCGTQENLVCRNNIFYAPAQQYTSIQLDCCKSYTFENNLYYNFPDSFFAEWTGIADEKAIRNVNPQITVAQDRTGYEKLALFKPTEQSVFSLGMALAEQNAKDILGQDAKNKTYLGAFCA